MSPLAAKYAENLKDCLSIKENLIVTQENSSFQINYILFTFIDTFSVRITRRSNLHF